MLSSFTDPVPTVPRDWRTVALGDVIAVAGDGGTPSRQIASHFGGDIPWVVISDIRPNIRSTADTLTAKGLANSNAKLWPPGSVIVSTGATIGEVGVAEVPLATKQGITGLVCGDALLPAYLAACLRHGKVLLERLSQGSTFREIRPPTLLRLRLLLPPVPEQRRIAEILDTLDQAISGTEQLVAKLNQMKHGLLHDLLTHGVDENGEVRDPDRTPEKFRVSQLGRIPMGWEIRSTAHLAEVLDHLRVPVNSDERARRQGSVPYYGANGQQGWIDRPLFNEPLILLAEDGGNFDDFAERPIAYRVDGPAWVNNHAHILRARPEVDQGWLFCALVHRDIRRYISGGTRSKLTQGELLSVQFAVPPRAEQRRIAAMVEGMKQRIEAEAQFATKLHALKKGVVEDLLSGRVRVPALHDEAAA